MASYLLIVANCITKDVRGFEVVEKSKKIKIPLYLKPPKANADLIRFAEEYWEKKELIKGAGPDGEEPEIQISKILQKKIV